MCGEGEIHKIVYVYYWMFNHSS